MVMQYNWPFYWSGLSAFFWMTMLMLTFQDEPFIFLVVKALQNANWNRSYRQNMCAGWMKNLIFGWTQPCNSLYFKTKILRVYQKHEPRFWNVRNLTIILLFMNILIFLKMGQYVGQVSCEIIRYLRMTLNYWSHFLLLSNAGFAGIHTYMAND